MAERISETLQKKLSGRLGFYEDLGIRLFYRDRPFLNYRSPKGSDLAEARRKTRIAKDRAGRGAGDSKDRIAAGRCGTIAF
jgi:hypothetical protein